MTDVLEVNTQHNEELAEKSRKIANFIASLGFTEFVVGIDYEGETSSIINCNVPIALSLIHSIHKTLGYWEEAARRQMDSWMAGSKGEA